MAQSTLQSLFMSLVKEIEVAVSRLSEEEMKDFRAWFTEYDAQLWDKQFESDVAAGRLDALAEEALADVREGRSSEL